MSARGISALFSSAAVPVDLRSEPGGIGSRGSLPVDNPAPGPAGNGLLDAARRHWVILAAVGALVFFSRSR